MRQQRRQINRAVWRPIAIAICLMFAIMALVSVGERYWGWK